MLENEEFKSFHIELQNCYIYNRVLINYNQGKISLNEEQKTRIKNAIEYMISIQATKRDRLTDEDKVYYDKILFNEKYNIIENEEQDYKKITNKKQNFMLNKKAWFKLAGAALLGAGLSFVLGPFGIVVASAGIVINYIVNKNKRK